MEQKARVILVVDHADPGNRSLAKANVGRVIDEEHMASKARFGKLPMRPR
jgi:hypothetical protein